VSLPTSLNSVEKLQSSLQAKAKSEPGYRFYSLWDKIYREDVLREAYRRSKANAGAPGVDGIDFKAIEAGGVERWLKALQEELRSKSYAPQPLLRVWIPKRNGGQRPLGILTVKDRVVQTALVLVLSPIFEEDLVPQQYGFRPNRDAKMAVRRVYFHITQHDRREVVDADLSDYFTTIPHGPLLRCVIGRVADGQVLSVIKSWLRVPVWERTARGSILCSTEARDRKRGTPQGGTLTPLTQKVILRIWGTPGVPSGGWRAAGRGRCSDRNAVSNNEGVIADQNVLDDESHDSLPFHDIERVGRVSQSCQKSSESLRQAQEHGAVVGLVGDCSGLLAQRLFPPAQRRHSLAKLLE
jgi:RNA-directed DNA polymerase